MESLKDPTSLLRVEGAEVNVNTTGNTDLRGAVLASTITDEDGNTKDNNNLTLNTGSLTHSDMKDREYSSSTSASISTNVSINPNKNANPNDPVNDAQDVVKLNTSLGTYANSSSLSLTTQMATLGNGRVNIGGKETETDSTLNRDMAQTSNDIYAVDRTRGDIDVTVDHRLLSEDGREEIAQEMTDVIDGIKLAVDITGQVIDSYQQANQLVEAMSAFTPEEQQVMIDAMNQISQLDKNPLRQGLLDDYLNLSPKQAKLLSELYTSVGRDDLAEMVKHAAGGSELAASILDRQEQSIPVEADIADVAINTLEVTGIVLTAGELAVATNGVRLLVAEIGYKEAAKRLGIKIKDGVNGMKDATIAVKNYIKNLGKNPLNENNVRTLNGVIPNNIGSRGASAPYTGRTINGERIFHHPSNPSSRYYVDPVTGRQVPVTKDMLASSQSAPITRTVTGMGESAVPLTGVIERFSITNYGGTIGTGAGLSANAWSQHERNGGSFDNFNTGEFMWNGLTGSFAGRGQTDIGGFGRGVGASLANEGYSQAFVTGEFDGDKFRESLGYGMLGSGTGIVGTRLGASIPRGSRPSPFINPQPSTHSTAGTVVGGVAGANAQNIVNGINENNPTEEPIKINEVNVISSNLVTDDTIQDKLNTEDLERYNGGGK